MFRPPSMHWIHMEDALVFLRVLVFRRATRPSRRGARVSVDSVPRRKGPPARPRPPTPLKTQESRRGAFFHTEKPRLLSRDLLFIGVLLALFIAPWPGSDGAASLAPADLPQGYLQNAGDRISHDDREKIEAPGSSSPTGQARTFVVSIPSHTEKHIQLQSASTTSTRDTQADPSHAHSATKRKVPQERVKEGGATHSAYENGASVGTRKAQEVLPAAAVPEALVQEGERTRTVFDGTSTGAQVLKRTPTVAQKSVAVSTSVAGNGEDQENTADRSKLAASRKQTDITTATRGAGTREDSITVEQWLAAITTASLNPLEAAAVAAELPVVPLSKKEQMLVQQVLRQYGFEKVATLLQEGTPESDMLFDGIGSDGSVMDEALKREIYNAAVEELEAHRASHPSLGADRHRPIPSYDGVSKQQRDLIQRRAAELILLRIRDAMVAHAQKEYQKRQERLRQGLPSGPHFLLDVIERNKRSAGATPSPGIHPAKAQRSGSTPANEDGTREKGLTVWKELILRGHGGGVTPRWHFTDREVGRVKHDYVAQKEERRQVGQLPADDVEGHTEAIQSSAPAVTENRQATMAAIRDAGPRSQLQQMQEPKIAKLLFGDRLGYVSEPAAQQVEATSEFDDIQAAARAISMVGGEDREGMHSEKRLETKRPRREIPQILEAWKAAALAGDPLAVALVGALRRDAPRPPGDIPPEHGKPPKHPPAKRPTESAMFRQEAANQWHSPPLAAFAHLHPGSPELANYAEKIREDPKDTLAAPKRRPSNATEQLWTGQSGGTDYHEKPPLWMEQYKLTYGDLQMRSAAEASKAQPGQLTAEDRLVPKTFPPKSSLGGQPNRKRLQASSSPSLEQFIVSKPKANVHTLERATSNETIPKAVMHSLETTTNPYKGPRPTRLLVQRDVEQQTLHAKHADEYEEKFPTAPVESVRAVSGETAQTPLRQDGRQHEEDGAHVMKDEKKKKIPLHASAIGMIGLPPAAAPLAPEMVTGLGALPPPGATTPPMLFYLQHQQLSAPLTHELSTQQTPPAVVDRRVFLDSRPAPAAPESESHQPEVVVTLPLHAEREVAGPALRPGSTEREIAKFLSATLPVWTLGTTLDQRPTFSSAGSAAAAVADGATAEAATAASTPIVNSRVSPTVASYSFSETGNTDPHTMSIVGGWRFSPPPSPALQTLPARGAFTDDVNDTEQGGSSEEPNKEGPQSTYLGESNVTFSQTTLPHFSALGPPQQLPLPSYSSPTATSTSAGRDVHMDTKVVAQFLQSPTPSPTDVAWQQHAPYFFTPATEPQSAPYTGIQVSPHQLAAANSVEPLTLRPYLPPTAPLEPSHGHTTPDHHRGEPPLHAYLPRAYGPEGDRLDEEEGASLAARHMRGSGTASSLTAMVDGSARQAVHAAASALPHLAHSAEQLMSTTHALVNAGNALAKSLPIEEAAQIGQHLNDLRMRRKEGPPPNVGEPSVRCMSSGMICCVPQKAVGPEWKKKPPYLNDSSPSHRACQAHFVPLQDAVCAATEYDDKECGIQRIETSSMVVFKHNLHVRGPKRLTAICECHWKQSKSSGKVDDQVKIPMPSKAPGETVEGFAHWKYSTKAMIEGQAARARTEKLMSGLGAALKATALLTEQGSTVAERNGARTEQEADIPVDQSKRLRSGVSALADVLLEDKTGGPSMKYVKQALADIARAAGGE